jgi:mono/diheme cytochrome c family protein
MTYNSAMPPMSFLSDEEIAGALTFARSAWGNSGAPIKPEHVAKVRSERP